MARITSLNETVVFAFESTGAEQMILEAADVVREARVKGKRISKLHYDLSEQGHELTIYWKDAE